MESYRPVMGTSVEDLDTPCLLVDLDALEHNQQVIADTYRNTVCKMGHHVKNTKCPLLVHMQFRAGGTDQRICCAKVSEAEVMVEGGIRDIFIVNQIVTDDKIARLCSLARRAAIRVAIDDPENLRALSTAAQRHGVNIGVLIEVATSGRRSGIRWSHQGGIEKGVELAKLARDLGGITFRGVQSHQTLPGQPDEQTRRSAGVPFFQMCLDVKEAIEAAGIPVEIVSSGETFSYDVAATIPGVTEVEAGTYMLMSHTYDYMSEFRIAAKVLGTVISTPRAGVAIGGRRNEGARPARAAGRGRHAGGHGRRTASGTYRAVGSTDRPSGSRRPVPAQQWPAGFHDRPLGSLHRGAWRQGGGGMGGRRARLLSLSRRPRRGEGLEAGLLRHGRAGACARPALELPTGTRRR